MFRRLTIIVLTLAMILVDVYSGILVYYLCT